MTGPSGSSGDGEDFPHETADGPLILDASPRPRRRWRAAFFALAIAGVLAVAAWIPFGSRLLVIRSVTVTGTHLVPASEVLAVAGVQPGTALISVNTAQIVARVEAIRQVRSARVTKSWPDRLVIVIRERTPALTLAVPGGGYVLMDAHGVVMRRAATRPADLPLYVSGSDGATLRGDPDVAAAAAVLGELPAALRHSVHSVAAPSPDQVTLRLGQGATAVTVLWGSPGGAAAKAQELTMLMRTHAHYYDVSAPGTVTTR